MPIYWLMLYFQYSFENIFWVICLVIYKAIHQLACYWRCEEIGKPSENSCRCTKSMINLMLYFCLPVKNNWLSATLTSQWDITSAVCSVWNWTTWYTDSRTLELIVLPCFTLIGNGWWVSKPVKNQFKVMTEQGRFPKSLSLFNYGSLVLTAVL